MNNKYFCTICTPTYNRKELLPKLYNSLCAQTDKDFEWVIIDDGSTDKTKDYILEIKNNDNGFNIKYFYQENGGKHVAVNKGIELATSDVFAIVDSDDFLIDTAIEDIKIGFSNIVNCEGFAGIAFQRGVNQEKAIGTFFDQEYVDARSTEREKFNINGDKFEVFFTDVLKKNNFPVFKDEKFMTEAILWTRIAHQGYKIRWYNKIIYICEYLEGGLTDTREKVIEKSPKGYALYIKEQRKYGDISLKCKMGYYSFYYKIRRKAKKSIFEVSKELECSMFLLVLSYFMRVLIEKRRTKVKKKSRSRTVEALKNLVCNFMYQLVNTVTNILIPPLIISKYGSVVNGLISTIKQIINYIQLVGAGIAESTIVELYKPLADNDKKKINQIYIASGKTFNRAGTLFSFVALMVAFIYPLILNGEVSYISTVKIILALSLAGVSEFFVLGKCRTLLIADQKNYIVNISQIIGAIFSTITTILLIKFNFAIEYVQFFASLAYIFRIVILVTYIKKNYQYLGNKDKPCYEALSKRKDATIHQLASLIIFGSQTLFISKFCGLAEASVYSCYNLIFTGISTLLSTFSSAMLAGIGSVMAIDDSEKLKKIYRIYEYLYYILVFTFYITTYIMISSFINLYVGDITDAQYQRVELVILFSVLGILNCLRTPGATIINAKGHYKETKNRALCEMIICLVGQVILVNKFKIVGVLIATILSSLYRTIDVIWYSNKKILNQGVKGTILNILLNVSTLIIILNLFSNNFSSIQNYLQWGIIALIVTVITGIIVIIINAVFNKLTFKETVNYIKNFILFRRKSCD